MKVIVTIKESLTLLIYNNIIVKEITWSGCFYGKKLEETLLYQEKLVVLILFIFIVSGNDVTLNKEIMPFPFPFSSK